MESIWLHSLLAAIAICTFLALMIFVAGELVERRKWQVVDEFLRRHPRAYIRSVANPEGSIVVALCEPQDDGDDAIWGFGEGQTMRKALRAMVWELR